MTVIYFDGAERRIPKTRDHHVGIGIVVCSNGETKGYSHSNISDQSGGCEFVAFGIMLKKLRLETDLRQARLFTDCAPIAYASTHLHKENYLQIESDRLEANLLKYVVRPFGENLNELLAWLSILNIEKVKGHSGVVHNEYADYLAKYAISGSEEPPLTFNDWLKKGVRYWNDEIGDYQVKFHPFIQNTHE